MLTQSRRGPAESESRPNRKLNDGQIALHFAVKKGDAKCITLLLKSGADVNAIAYQKDTALHYAEDL